MAPVPERPFTFSSLLRSQHLLLLLVLGLLTGTDNVPTLLSLAHFNNRRSRAESLFTTFAFHTHTTTTHYCFHVAAACTNALATMAMSVAPLVFFPPLCGHRVPGHAGGAKHMAGGSQESHLAIKQTDNVRLLVLRLLLTHFHTHFNSQPSIPFTDWSGSGSIRWCYCGTVVPSIVFTGNFHTFAFTNARSSARRSSRKILSFRGLRAQPRLEENGGK